MGYKMTEEHKRKLRESNIGKKHNLSKESREKLSRLKKGKRLSKEVREAISRGHKEFYAIVENKERLKEWLKGHRCTEETKKKIGKGNKGKVYKQESRDKISKSLKDYFFIESKEHLEERIKKSNNSKRVNKTFNSSKPEEEAYILLKERFDKVERQYSSELYKHACDFYIEELELYIECHFGWMHGGKPFKSKKDDLYQKWLERSKEKIIYKQAIYTWSDLDVRKLKAFKENGLNYKIFYTFEEFLSWYKGV